MDREDCGGLQSMGSDMTEHAHTLRPPNLDSSCYYFRFFCDLREKLEEFQNKTDSPLNNVMIGLLYIQKGHKTTGITILDDFCDKEKNLLITSGIKNYLKELTKENL